MESFWALTACPIAARRHGVAGLVDGDPPALGLGQDVGLLRRARNHPVDRLLQGCLVDLGEALADREQRRLVDEVGQLGAAEAGAELGDLQQVDLGREAAASCVQLEDFQAPVHVGDVDGDLAVEAPGAEQGGVEDVGAVGGAHDDDAGVAAEAVHLDQQLVEGLLALVVALPDAGAALSPGGVELVDEDDRRRHLPRLGEEVADARRPDPDQRLDELGSGGGEEGGVGLASGGTGQERLAGPRRADQEHALGGGGAHRQVFARVLEEVADLAQLGERFPGPRHRVEGDRRRLALLPLLALAAEVREGADPARAVVAGLAHEEGEEADQDQDRQQELDDDGALGLARLGVDRDLCASRESAS